MRTVWCLCWRKSWRIRQIQFARTFALYAEKIRFTKRIYSGLRKSDLLLSHVWRCNDSKVAACKTFHGLLAKWNQNKLASSAALSMSLAGQKLVVVGAVRGVCRQWVRGRRERGRAWMGRIKCGKLTVLGSNDVGDSLTKTRRLRSVDARVEERSTILQPATSGDSARK